MRKIIIMEHISLDGVIEHGDDYTYGAWTAAYRSPDGLAGLIETYGTNYDVLLGRNTYDIWSRFWPNAAPHPMAAGLNAATKYVATQRPQSLSWGPVKDLGEDIVKGIRELKSEEGPDLIIAGSASLASVLLGEGLIDEVVLFVYPVLLGAGKRLLSDSVDARELAFVSTKATSSGILINTYKYVGSLQKPA